MLGIGGGFASICLAALSLGRGPNMAPKQFQFQLTTGTVTVYLPNEIEAGDRISGSVFAASKGDWQTQHDNLEAMDGLFLQVGDTRVPISDATFEVSVGEGPLGVELEDANGRSFASATLQLGGPVPTETPVVVQAGQPFGIAGKFSGDREQTWAYLSGRPAGILAEGRSECFVTAPADQLGAGDFRVTDGSFEAAAKVTVVRLSVLGPDSPVPAGARTSIGVDLEGLDPANANLFPVTIEMKVNDPGVAEFDGTDSSRGTLLVFPKDLVQGHVLKSLPITAKQGGAYNISCRVF